MWPYRERTDREVYHEEELSMLAKHAREQAGQTVAEVAEALGASVFEILEAERRTGPRWTALQRQIIEWCSGCRLEADVRYYLLEE